MLGQCPVKHFCFPKMVIGNPWKKKELRVVIISKAAIRGSCLSLIIRGPLWTWRRVCVIASNQPENRQHRRTRRRCQLANIHRRSSKNKQTKKKPHFNTVLNVIMFLFVEVLKLTSYSSDSSRSHSCKGNWIQSELAQWPFFHFMQMSKPSSAWGDSCKHNWSAGLFVDHFLLPSCVKLISTCGHKQTLF